MGDKPMGDKPMGDKANGGQRYCIRKPKPMEKPMGTEANGDRDTVSVSPSFTALPGLWRDFVLMNGA